MYDFNNIYQPKTIEEALKMKNEHPEALILAGGSDILIQVRDGKLAGCDVITQDSVTLEARRCGHGPRGRPQPNDVDSNLSWRGADPRLIWRSPHSTKLTY